MARALPLRCPGVVRRQPVGLGRAGPAGRGPRLQHAHHARPLHRAAGARAGADGGGRRHLQRCASAPSCWATTTGTLSCWPRSWPRSTSCPTAASRSGWARAGCAPTTSSRASPTTRAGVRIDRIVESLRVAQGAAVAEPADVVGEHYTVTGLAGFPKPVQQPRPPILIGGGGRRMLGVAAREADIVGINGTLAAGVIDAEALASMRRRGGGREDRLGPRRRRRALRRHRAERPGLLRRRHRRSRPGRSSAWPAASGSPPNRSRATPVRPDRYAVQQIADDLRSPAGAVGLLLRDRGRPRTSTPSRPWSRRSPAADAAGRQERSSDASDRCSAASAVPASERLASIQRCSASSDSKLTMRA